jgi:aryl-alcohol dehydrogenase-like predicted oxidoreductase
MELGSRDGLGTAPLSSSPDGPLWWGPQDDDESMATIRAAVDQGVAWVDTAPFYGWGLAKALVGRALDGVDRVTVLTKCGTRRGADRRHYEDASPESLRLDIDWDGVAWAARRPGTHAIVGARHRSEVPALASTLELTEDEIAALDV